MDRHVAGRTAVHNVTLQKARTERTDEWTCREIPGEEGSDGSMGGRLDRLTLSGQTDIQTDQCTDIDVTLSVLGMSEATLTSKQLKNYTGVDPK